MKLFFREFGEGKPMIILHGLFGLSDNWVPLARTFADSLNMKVYVPDQRNHGMSAHHPVFNYHALVDDLAEFYDEHDITSAILLGHSMGGKVAMHFALDYPANVEGLIVADISPVTYQTHRHAFLLEVMSEIYFENFRSRKEIESEMMKKVPDKRLVNFMMKNIRTISRDKLAWKMNIESLKLNLEEVFKFEPSGRNFAKPVLWLKGELSDYIQQHHHHEMFSLFPSTDLKIIENATHWLHSDQPVLIASTITEWLLHQRKIQ